MKKLKTLRPSDEVLLITKIEWSDDLELKKAITTRYAAKMKAVLAISGILQGSGEAALVVESESGLKRAGLSADQLKVGQLLPLFAAKNRYSLDPNTLPFLSKKNALEIANSGRDIATVSFKLSNSHAQPHHLEAFVNASGWISVDSIEIDGQVIADSLDIPSFLNYFALRGINLSEKELRDGFALTDVEALLFADNSRIQLLLTTGSDQGEIKSFAKPSPLEKAIADLTSKLSSTERLTDREVEHLQALFITIQGGIQNGSNN